MRMRRSGFSILELVVATGLFLIVSVLIFSFFRYGTRSFKQANDRHGLQVEGLRVLESIQGEMKRTNRSSIQTQDRTININIEGNPTAVRRDAFSFVTLQKWGDRTNSNNYDLASGAPLWNRYITFYATQEEVGKIVRLKLDPSPPPQAPKQLPLSDLTKVLSDNPKLNKFDGITPPFVTLSNKVVSFTFDEGKQTNSTTGEVERTGDFTISLKLKEKHSKSATDGHLNREYDYYELRMTVRPENSFPSDL